MRAVPFHRRILPWIFVVVFLAMAPAVVFYTSGYRYDAKRGKIERNGTVIIDTVPNGAKVWIDGRDSGKTTPITIQDMVPGTHSFRIQKDGYHEWHKNLDVYPERVTFANAVKLWPMIDPTFLLSTQAESLSPSPNSTAIFMSTSGTADIPTLSALTLSTIPNFHISSLQAVTLVADLRQADISWSTNGRHAIASLPDRRAWLIDSQVKSSPISLPVGRYRWEGRTAIGVDGRVLTTIATDGTLTRSTFVPNIVDQIDDLELRMVTSTSQLVFTSPSHPGKGFILPHGNWRFWSTDRTATILRDGDRWLSLTEAEDGSFVPHEARGKSLRLFQDRRGTKALLIAGNELSQWDLRSQPELLYRQSEDIVQADWASSGAHVFFATRSSLFALELDARDGRKLDLLATFDRLDGVVFYKNTLILLGKKGVNTGVWGMKVE